QLKAAAAATAPDAAERAALDLLLQHTRCGRHDGADDVLAEGSPEAVAARFAPGSLRRFLILRLRCFGLGVIGRALLQDLVGRFPILGLVVDALDRACIDHGLALGIGDRTDA